MPICMRTLCVSTTSLMGSPSAYQPLSPWDSDDNMTLSHSVTNMHNKNTAYERLEYLKIFQCGTCGPIYIHTHIYFVKVLIHLRVYV